MKAFLVDDEELALKRLARLLERTGRVEIAGSSTDPVDAAALIRATQPDLLFLDIEMPGMNGFALLEQLDAQPLVIFTTAYDRYALEAFGVNSVDYLLKPIEAEHLDRALNKIDRIRGGAEPRREIEQLLSRIRSVARQPASAQYTERVASRVGDRVELVPVASVSHFYSSDKLTFAATNAKDYAIDLTIQELERKLDPNAFVRIHRASLVNLGYVQDLHTWFAGRLMVRLKNEKKTELTVARDRVRELKEKLGI